jgi:hypothetical protein
VNKGREEMVGGRDTDWEKILLTVIFLNLIKISNPQSRKLNNPQRDKGRVLLACPIVTLLPPKVTVTPPRSSHP